MLLPEQADGIALPIDNQRKQVQNVAAEDAHVQGLQACETGKLAAEESLALLIAITANLCCHDDRIGRTSNAIRRSGLSMG